MMLNLGTTKKILFVLINSYGRACGVKIIKWNFAEMPLSWDISHYVKKTEKTKISLKVADLTPQSR